MKLKLLPGSKVKLLRDITTQGGRTFRAGVIMTCQDNEQGCYLSVMVRADYHELTLKLQDEGYDYVVVSEPKKEDQ